MRLTRYWPLTRVAVYSSPDVLGQATRRPWAFHRRQIRRLVRFLTHRDVCSVDVHLRRGAVVIQLRKRSRRIPGREVPPRRRGLTLGALRAHYDRDRPPRTTLAFRLKVRQFFGLGGLK